MGLVGRDSKSDFGFRMGRIASRIEGLEPSDTPPARVMRRRRRPGVTTDAIVSVLGSVEEMRFSDIHAAVEALLDEPVPTSTVKTCLARHASSAESLFERSGRGCYRLRRC